MHPRDSFGWYVIAVLLAVLSSGSDRALNAQQQLKVRTIRASSNVPIVERLLPDDQVVVIARDYDYEHIEPEPDTQGWIDYAIQSADTVAVVEVREAVTVLVDNGTWLDTKITGLTRDILKTSSERRTSTNEAIEVETVGGELKIGNVLVQTNESLRFARNSNYLMFLRVFGKHWSIAYPPLLIDDGRLVGTHTQGAALNKLHGATLDDVRRRMKAWVEKP